VRGVLVLEVAPNTALQRLARQTKQVRLAQQRLQQYAMQGKNIELRLRQEEPLLTHLVSADETLPTVARQVAGIVENQT
jgi:chaperonin cofactor prefoldin